MRIAYVTETYPPEINGVSLTVARAVSYLRGRGHVVELVRPAQAGESRGPGDGEWRCVGWPIPVYRDMRFGVAPVSELAGSFDASRAQLVHVATEGPLGRAAVAAARRLGIPSTSDFRTNFHAYSRYYRLGLFEPVIKAYLRGFHNATDRTFVPTEHLRSELSRAGFDRLTVVGRGVDLERFSPSRRDRELRREWGCVGNEPVLLHVGRLAAEKKVELALEAFRAAARFDARAKMVVVGDGPRRRALERAFPEARFVGVQTGAALAACYASADLFLFASESETFGNVTVEALASGLPVIAFDCAAAAQHVVDRGNGRLVPPGDDQGFINATCMMLAVERIARGAEASAAARRSVSAEDWETVLGHFERKLLETADDARRSRAPAARAA